MNNQLVGIVLKVSNPQNLALWYKDVLGMSIKQVGSNWICEYEKFNQTAKVKLVKGSGSPFQGYWTVKIK